MEPHSSVLAMVKWLIDAAGKGMISRGAGIFVDTFKAKWDATWIKAAKSSDAAEAAAKAQAALQKSIAAEAEHHRYISRKLIAAMDKISAQKDYIHKLEKKIAENEIYVSLNLPHHALKNNIIPETIPLKGKKIASLANDEKLAEKNEQLAVIQKNSSNLSSKK